jgi:phenylacetate-CoA ligase
MTMATALLTKPEEESKLLAALSRAATSSEFWRARFAGLGLGASDFNTGFPFHELPLLTKQDLLRDQAETPPFGKLIAVTPEQVRRIHKTSGTTATPLFIALTERDIADTYIASRRALRLAGVGPGDRVVHCLNFNMWSGGITDYLPFEDLGATAIPYGVGGTAALLHTIRTLGVNAISSTPSYMFTLRDRCREELGIEPKALGLKRGYFGGEGLLQLSGVRAEIEEAFGMTAIDANYGMSEVLSIIAGEEPGRDGLVYHAHGILYAELIDASGRSLPIEPGAKGEVAFSSLRREAQPLFRYRTNDLIEILATDIGEEGLMRIRYRVAGRTDEMLVIKGVNFFPQSLVSLLHEFEPEVSRAFRVVRPTQAKPRELAVWLETRVADGAARAVLARKIADRVSALLAVRIAIEWVPWGSMPTDGNKGRYLVEREEGRDGRS